MIELNPNPSLRESSCLPAMAKLMNISYDDLIEEIIERNGKKRVFIPEEIREMILKSVKVRVGNKRKNGGKNRGPNFRSKKFL